jgi:hypothetical protein
MQDHLDASPLLTGHGNERHLQQPSQPAVPAKVDDKVKAFTGRSDRGRRP